MTRAPAGPGWAAGGGTGGSFTSGRCAAKARLRPLRGEGGSARSRASSSSSAPARIGTPAATSAATASRVASRPCPFRSRLTTSASRSPRIARIHRPHAACGPCSTKTRTPSSHAREDGRAQVERPVRLAEDRLRAALGRRHVAARRGVRVEAGGRPRPDRERGRRRPAVQREPLLPDRVELGDVDRERVAETQSAAPAQRLHDAGAPVLVAGDDAVLVAVDDREVDPLFASQRPPSRRRRERGPSRRPSGPDRPTRSRPPRSSRRGPG